ncbi:MAG: SDR family NAD(P)-dependent oxidoreductase [Albidovulum sp.]|nr:SDR family NAD(P)-dependent oxidoreductase [Albidovulum sp.]
MNSFQCKVAVVTGGGKGIGRAVAGSLAEKGASVVACGRGERPDDLPDCIYWCRADVSAFEDVARLRYETERVFERASIIVNNAGVQIEKSVVESTEDDWNRVVGTNCKGVFNMCREFIPSLKTAGGGSIINVGSISGDAADPNMALYNASKGFVHALTRSIAVDHGPAIRCNAIRPGWIMTGMADSAFAMAADPEAAMRDSLLRHPSGRFGVPEDVARLVVWLASDESEFVNGACITADGGMTAASPIRPGLM